MDSDAPVETPPAPKVLLVPVDFSPNALYALRWADELATALGAEIKVLHIVHDPAENPGFYTRDKKQKKKWRKRLETFTEIAAEMMADFLEEALKELPKDGPVGRAEQILVRGTVVKRVIEVAKKIDAYLIVLASHGRTKTSRFLLGSKASKISQVSPIPVTIVSHPKEAKP